MLPYVLNLVYGLVALLASPLLLRNAILKGKYREGWREKLFGQVPRPVEHRTCVWLHAVSVGEVNLFQTLLPRLVDRYPEIQFVVSVTTKAAYDFARLKFPQQTVFYCPLDFSWSTKEALSRLRPVLLVLAEAELWPNLIRYAKRTGTRVALINGRLSEKSFRGYQKVAWLFSRLVKSLDVICVQTDQYAQRFQMLGAARHSVRVTGSIKFDGANSNRQQASVQALRRLAGFSEKDRIFLAGSTQAPEELLALHSYLALRDHYPGLRLVLVPRHTHRFDKVDQLLSHTGICYQRRSQLAEDGLNSDARVLLVDSIGELAAWWGTADIAYVGGSMGRRGGQNMIEPAAYGAAVSFGPKTGNFRDVVSLMLHERAAMVVENGEQLTAFVRRCLDDEPFSEALGSRAAKLVAQQQGATQRTMDALQGLLERHPAGNQVQSPAA